ncbi:MAG: hypothetical protein EOO02_06525 [Chitinophagaceae bacterium]|nr:MAG: hypothetical protein EOO02_06525 [Chitinophagaceae bacterium]
MPANKKYLSTPGQRVLKISAALFGGYLVTITFHLFLLSFTSRQPVFDSMSFSTWLIWATLMIVAFLSTNGWKIWGCYLLAAAIFISPYIYQIYLAK